MRRVLRRWVLTAGLLLILLPWSVAYAAPAPQTIGHGGVVQLAGTQHLFVSWEGQLHWAADTRALAGRSINWSERHTLDLATLRRYPIGDPWLSTGLVKSGDPIYLAKWETNECCPRLLHIQAIADVELFGINGGNYGRFVIDQPEWERRTGFATGNLSRGRLDRAVEATPTPRPLPTATPRPAPTVAAASGSYGVIQVVDWSLPSCSDLIATAIFLNRGNPEGLARALQGVRCNPLNLGGSGGNLERVTLDRASSDVYVERFGNGRVFETQFCFEFGSFIAALYDSANGRLIFTSSGTTCTVRRIYR